MESKSLFNRGPHTFSIPARLFRENRERLCERLKNVGNIEKNAYVLLQGGKSTTRYCSDHEPIFRQESYFHWAFGVEEPDFYGTIHVDSGKTTIFPPKLDPSYAVWMGKLKTETEYRDQFEVEDVIFADKILEFFRNVKPSMILTLYGLNTDSQKYSEPASFEGMNEFYENREILHPEISECRVFKSDLELDVLRYTNKVASEGHKEVMCQIRPGMYEYQLESIFRHYSYYFGGSRFQSYTCICGSGENAAILHYGHAGNPNSKLINDGDICLFDMGAEYGGYASDITCSFPVNGKFTDKQKVIYNAVLKANRAVFNAIRPGVNWVDMHKLAERVQLEELKAAGLLQGDVDRMMEVYLGAVFMPHGLGHFMGIDTHDVGGYNHSDQRSNEPGLRSLRTNRTLQARMVLTIEPGIYFNDVLLEEAMADPQRSCFFVPDVIDQYRDSGGVRIEDDIIVKENGAELLTDVPRTVEEIETFFANRPQPKMFLPDQISSIFGVNWVDMHKLAERVQLEELKAAGLLQGDVDRMMEVYLGAVFMPHGLGHFMGIDTHDVGGYNHSDQRSNEPGLRSLRTNRTLQARMVLTIEPGIYFNDVLLEEAMADPQRSCFFVPDVIDQYRDSGGVRIEDDIIVKENGAELLTDVPRTVEEIETFFANRPQPKMFLPDQISSIFGN